MSIDEYEERYNCPYYDVETGTCPNVHCINCIHNTRYRSSSKSCKMLLAIIVVTYLIVTFCLYSG